MTRTAVVVGAGLAGLTAAYYLRRASWDVVVLESAERVGGRVATVRKDGYTIDTGATQMSSSYHEYLKLCRELGLAGEMIESHSVIGILRNGRIHTIDSRSMVSGALSPLLSWRGKLALLKAAKDYRAVRPPVDVLDVSRSHSVDVESAAQYAARELNPELFAALVDPLVRTYVMNGAQNVSALEWFSTVRNLGGARMLSINGGNDRLAQTLTQHVPVRLRTAALAVRKAESVVEVTTRSAAGEEQIIAADAAVIATRFPEALALHPPLRATAGKLAQSLRYNRAWVVSLGYKRQPECNVVGVMFPTAESPVVGLLWCEHKKNPDRVPRGHALFSVYSDEAANDQYLHLSDAQLSEFAAKFVEKLFPELTGHLDLTHVTRWPMAIPNPAPGVYKDLAQMKEQLDPADRVQLAGDYFTCTGQNSAIHYGRRAAENLLVHHGETGAERANVSVSRG